MISENYQTVGEILKFVLIALGLLAVALIIFGTVYLLLRERRNRKSGIERVFGNRESLSEQAFHEKYFKSRGVPFEVTAKVRRILQDELGTDMSRLSDQDDFNGNLFFFWEGDGLESVLIITRIEEEFGISISDDEAAGMNTIENLVLKTWAKVQEDTSQAP